MAFVIEDDEQKQQGGRFIIEEEQPQALKQVESNWFEQNMPASTRIAKSLYGLPEAATTMATGLGASAVGGLAGIAGTLLPGKEGQGSKWVENVQSKLTYQPKTYTGQKIIEGASAITDAANQGLGYIGGKIGSVIGSKSEIAGEEIGKALIPVASTLYGGAQGLQAAKAANVAKVLAQQKANVADAGKIDAANAAKKYNLKLNPVEASSGTQGKVLTGIAKPEDINANLSSYNNAKLTQIAKRDLGISSDSPLTTSETFKLGRKKAGTVYEDVKKLGQIPQEYAVEFAAKLNSLNNFEGMTPSAAAYMKQNTPTILADFEQLSKNGFNSTDVVNFSRKYRKEANTVYKKELTGGMSVEEAALADAKIGIANALEDMISKHSDALAKTNPRKYSGLSERWKDARSYIAKSHTWENATDLNTGKIDATAIAKQTAKDSALTGPLKDVGNIAGNFPEVFQKSTKHKPLTTIEHFSRYGMGGMTGGLAGSGIGFMVGGPAGIIPGATTGMLAGGAIERGLQPLAMKTLMSEMYQKGIKVPEYYKPPIVQTNVIPDNKLHPDTIIPQEETGLSLAPKGSRLSPIKYAEQEPKTRGLLSFADDNYIKNKPVEYKPGEVFDFKLRQEVLQNPMIVKIVRDYQNEARRLESLIQNSGGFWKKRYAAELEELKQNFAKLMKPYGITTPEQATGLRVPLYEGKATRFPIVKGGGMLDKEYTK